MHAVRLEPLKASLFLLGDCDRESELELPRLSGILQILGGVQATYAHSNERCDLHHIMQSMHWRLAGRSIFLNSLGYIFAGYRLS